MPRVHDEPLVIDPLLADETLHDVLRAARAAAPTAIAESHGAVVVLDYDEIEWLTRDRRLVGVGTINLDFIGVGDGPLRDWFNGLLITLEGEAHDRLRRLVARAFTPRAVEQHRAFTADLVRARLDRLVADGGGDLLQALHDVPITAVCQLLGVPAGDVSRFIDYGEALGPIFTLTTAERVERAIATFGPFLDDVERVVAERAAAPGDDLVSALLATEADGDRLTHDELVRTISNLIVGGHDTTNSQAACMLLTLLRHPHTLAAVRAGAVGVDDVVTEAMRYEPGVPFIGRVNLEPLVVSGTEQPAGSLLVLALAAANRQPDKWPDPDTFRPERFTTAGSSKVMMSFGGGIHHCLGAAMATMILEEMVRGVADVSDRIEPVDATTVAWQTLLGRGPSTVDVRAVRRATITT